MKTEHELMSDFDPEKYDGRFCKKIGCSECAGTDYNGEPNGYGCAGNDEYIEKRYQSILKRRRAKEQRTTATIGKPYGGH